MCTEDKATSFLTLFRQISYFGLPLHYALLLLHIECQIVLSDEDDDDDDDTEALMAELERIKKERAEEKLRKVCYLCIFVVVS